MRLALYLSVCVFWGFSLEADACRCLEPPPPKEALRKSDAVFSGRVLEVKELDRLTYGVKFTVLTTWKGVESKTVTVQTSSSGAACGYDFKVNERYLVYCFNKGKQLTTNICTRTTSLNKAGADLAAIGEGKSPKNDG